MRKSSQKGCYDNTGQKRKHADQWKVNDCKTCTCKVSSRHIVSRSSSKVFKYHQVQVLLRSIQIEIPKGKGYMF